MSLEWTPYNRVARRNLIRIDVSNDEGGILNGPCLIKPWLGNLIVVGRQMELACLEKKDNTIMIEMGITYVFVENIVLL